MSREHISELLFTAQGDLLISAEPLLESGIENQIIDSFKSFVCICSSKHAEYPLTTVATSFLFFASCVISAGNGGFSDIS